MASEKPTTNYHDDLCRVFAHRDFTFDDVSDRKSNKLTLRESRLSINLTYYGGTLRINRLPRDVAIALKKKSDFLLHCFYPTVSQQFKSTDTDIYRVATGKLKGLKKS